LEVQLGNRNKLVCQTGLVNHQNKLKEQIVNKKYLQKNCPGSKSDSTRETVEKPLFFNVGPP
jgi:hypothetical protein